MGGSRGLMRAGLATLAALGLACAPLPRNEPLSPVPRNQPRIGDAIRSAQARFDTAAQAGNIQQMASVFAEDALLITQGSDSVQGRSAIAAYLAAARPGATGAKFWFAREPPLRLCHDGGFEHAQFTALVRGTDQAVDTLRARLAILWTRDSTGAARVQRAAFSEKELTRKPTSLECMGFTAVARRVQMSRRFSATLLVGLSLGSTSRDLQSAMIARGWADSGYLCSPFTSCAEQTTPHLVHTLTIPVVPVLRFRFSTRVAANLLVGALPQVSVYGISSAANSQLGFSWSGAYAGVLLSYELAGFALGVGPAVQTVHWRVDDRDWPYTVSTIYESSYRKTGIGLIGGIQRTQPLIGRWHMDVHVYEHWFRHRTPSAPNFPAVSTGNSTFLAVGLGLAL